MVSPIIFVRLSGPAAGSDGANRALRASGFDPRILDARSNPLRSWIEVDVPGTLNDVDSLRSRVERAVAGTAFLVREYGPQAGLLSSP